MQNDWIEIEEFQPAKDTFVVKVLKPENVSRELILGGPTPAITVASRARVKQVVKTQETLSQLVKYNPDLPQQIDNL